MGLQSELRTNPRVSELLFAAAEMEIKEKNVDSFTLGCGCFYGMAKPLEVELRKRYGNHITVIDPVEAAIEKLFSLIK